MTSERADASARAPAKVVEHPSGSTRSLRLHLLLLAGITIVLVVAAAWRIWVVVVLAAVPEMLAAVWTVGQARVHRAWGPARVAFPVWPLLLGTRTTVRIERTARRAGVGAPTVTARVRAVEWVEYLVGEDLHEATHEVVDGECPAQVISVPRGPGQGFAADVDIAVPVAAPPTLRLSRNQIRWTLLVQLSGAGPEETFELPLDVATAVDPAAVP